MPTLTRILGLFLLLSLLSTPTWAAICFVGGQTGSFAGVTSAQTINFSLSGGDAPCANSAPQTGDLVLVSYGTASTSDQSYTIDAPDNTDYTLLGTEGYASDVFDANRRTGYRVMPSPTETQVVLSGTGGINNAGAFTIHVLRNVHATPLEQAVQQGSIFNTSQINPGDITPTTAGTWVYVVGVGALGTGRQGVYTSSDLSHFLSSAQDDTNAVNIGAGLFQWTSGQVSPATFGGGGTPTGDDSGQWLIAALAPAAVAASTGGNGLMMGVD